jgi:heme A synthase
VSESAAAIASGDADQATSDEYAESVRRVRAFSLAQVVLLLVQTGLGIWVSIYSTLPGADEGKGLLSSFGNSISKGPMSVATHAGFGMLVFINACLLIIFALTVRDTTVRAASVIGWLCIVGAAVSGATFLNATQDSSSAKQRLADHGAADPGRARLLRLEPVRARERDDGPPTATDRRRPILGGLLGHA